MEKPTPARLGMQSSYFAYSRPLDAPGCPADASPSPRPVDCRPSPENRLTRGLSWFRLVFEAARPSRFERPAMTNHEKLLLACNAYRQSRGLPPYESGEKERVIAQNWANWMAMTGNLRHGGGEQIIARSSDDQSAEGVIRIWRNSPPHNRELLASYRRAGFGAAAGPYGWYYAGAFDGGIAGVPSKPIRPAIRPWWLRIFGFGTWCGVGARVWKAKWVTP